MCCIRSHLGLMEIWILNCSVCSENWNIRVLRLNITDSLRTIKTLWEIFLVIEPSGTQIPLPPSAVHPSVELAIHQALFFAICKFRFNIQTIMYSSGCPNFEAGLKTMSMHDVPCLLAFLLI